MMADLLIYCALTHIVKQAHPIPLRHERLPFRLGVGLTRPLSIEYLEKIENRQLIPLLVEYELLSDNRQLTLQVDIPVVHKSIHEAHKFTHRHPSGIVSAASLKAPNYHSACAAACAVDPQDLQRCEAPIVIQLHGAGVRVDDNNLTRSVDSLADACAWILLPSGVTTWSADDWRTFYFLLKFPSLH